MDEKRKVNNNLKISVENAKLIGNDETDDNRTPMTSKMDEKMGATTKFGFDEKELNAKMAEVSDEAVHVMNKMSMKLRDLTNKLKAKSSNNSSNNGSEK